MADRYRIKHHFDTLWMPGGYTIVIDMVENVAGISLCSDKDQFGRKKGVAVAKDRIDVALASRPSGCSPKLGAVIAPKVNGRQANLLKSAIGHAVRLMLDFVPELDALMVAYDWDKERWWNSEHHYQM